MSLYKIEDDIDFYAELYKSLNDDHDSCNDADVCLITSEPLKENNVKLPCNHSFNYVAIYKDLVNYKKKHSHLDIIGLKVNQIRCPYCRIKHDMLLPFYEDIPGVEKEHGVNFIDQAKLNGTPKSPTSCCQIMYYTNGTGEAILCNRVGSLLNEDGKYYCNSHKNKMMKYFHNLALKEEKKKKREDERKQKLEEKKAANVVISSGGCVETLKTGYRKGQPCGACSIYLNNMCMRHYNMNQKPYK